jgi:chemotaxis protein methyltransferase CheR
VITIRENEFHQLVDYVKSHCGLDLSSKRHLIEGRLQNVLASLDLDSFGKYFEFVVNDKTGEAVTTLLNKLTTNHTYFMREKEHFNLFREKVLPYLADSVKSKDLRIWSAGCSTGEEPYTLAMILNDFFSDKKWLWDTRVLATDISRKALDIAAEGVYSSEQVGVLPEKWQKNYLQPFGEERYRIVDKIREEVIFRAFNLMNPVYPFKRKFHVIFCRNVMIYFDGPTKKELLDKYYENTEPGGYLFIGHAESIPRDTTKYKYVLPAVYRKE